MLMVFFMGYTTEQHFISKNHTIFVPYKAQNSGVVKVIFRKLSVHTVVYIGHILLCTPENL